MKKELLSALKVYIFNWLFIITFFLFRIAREDISITKAFELFIELLANSNFLMLVHIIFILFYVIFLIFRYFYRVYKKRGSKIALKGFLLKFIIPILIIYSSFSFITYKNRQEAYNYIWNTTVENNEGESKRLFFNDGKHRGASVFGWGKDNGKAIDEMVKNNIEWVAVIPFLYQDNENSTQINIPDQIGGWSKRDSIFINVINDLHDKGLYTHLKPHLWLGEGWRSNLKMASEEEWDTWFSSYEKGIIHYAKMAEETNTELFCIGTELRTSIKNQPEKWHTLIKKVRSIYKGKLTYAANWDEKLELIGFWEELDYIGVQAYFPLTKVKNPNLQEIKKGWERHIITLEDLSKSKNKPILFTEIGYKSEASATIKPWEWNSFLSPLTRKKSDKTQQLAYEAMFEVLWDKEWFSGIYIWEWNVRSQRKNAVKSLDFSPRYKPAENTLAKWYGKEIY